MSGRQATLAEAATDLVTRARTRFGVRRAALFLLDRDGRTLVCVETAGDGAREAWVGRTLAGGVGVAGRTVAQGRPVWSPDLLADAHIPLAEWLRERLRVEGLRSVVAAPVMAERETVGALGLLDPAGREYGDEEIQALAALTAQAAPSLRAAWRAHSQIQPQVQ